MPAAQLVEAKRPAAGWITLLRQQIQRAGEAGTHTDGGEIPAVAGENPVHLAPLRYGSHRAIDES